MILKLLLLLFFSEGLLAVHKESTLREKLLLKYDPDALPAYPTNLSIGFSIQSIEMDESRQVLYIGAYVRMFWNDPRLKWPVGFSDIQKITFQESQVWTPDLTLYTSDELNVGDHLTEGFLVLGYESGKMLHVPPALLPAPCDLDMTYWPYDVHTCKVKLGSWVHSMDTLPLGPQMDKTNGKAIDIDEPNMKSYDRRNWQILDYSLIFQTKTYDCCEELYTNALITLKIARNAPAQQWFFKIMLFVVSSMTAVLFLLPSSSNQKAVVGSVLMVLDLAFLYIADHYITSSVTHLPLLMKWVGEQMVLTLVCTVATTLVARMAQGPHADALPSYLRKVVDLLEKPFCLQGYGALMRNGDSQHDGLIDGKMADTKFLTAASVEWMMLGCLLDKLFLAVYLVILAIIILRFYVCL